MDIIHIMDLVYITDLIDIMDHGSWREKEKKKKKERKEINYYQYAFNSQKNIYMGRNARNIKKWLACGPIYYHRTLPL